MTRVAVLQEVAAVIAARVADHPIRVAIDGIDASGKTTLADDLVEPLRARGYPVIRASIDDFHQPADVRRRRGIFSAEGYYDDAFDYEGLKMTLLEPLGAAGSGRYCTAVYDYRTETVVDAEWRRADPRSILLMDGVFLQRPELNAYWDVRIWVDVPFDVAFERALKRDGELFGSVEILTERYTKRYFPAQDMYFSRCQPQKNADLIVENSNPLQPSLIRNQS